MLILEKEVRYCKTVGAVKARDFARLGITTLYDALFDIPFRHDDLSNRVEIVNIKSGEKVTVGGTIAAITNRRSNRNRRMIVTEAIIEDGTGSIKAIWFHQGFLTKILKTGTVVSLAGKTDDKYGLSLINPAYEVMGNAIFTKHTGRIVPIYSLTGGLTQKGRGSVVELALEGVNEIEEWLPNWIIKQEHFISLQTALANIHFPNS